MKRGYFSVGVYHPKFEVNVGTLWRSAFAFGAAYCFIVGARKRVLRQASDTTQSHKHIPFFTFDSMEHLTHHLPYDCRLVGVELDEKARNITQFSHFERCAFLLGAEDSGLPKAAREKCHALVQIPGRHCLNVAVAGSIAMYSWKEQYPS